MLELSSLLAPFGMQTATLFCCLTLTTLLLISLSGGIFPDWSETDCEHRINAKAAVQIQREGGIERARSLCPDWISSVLGTDALIAHCCGNKRALILAGSQVLNSH